MMKNRKSEEVLFRIINNIWGNQIVKNIVEVGARDCNETLQFAKQYPNAKIITFECNPNTLPICRQRIANYPNIKLIEKAVFTTEGKIKFYPTNAEKTVTAWEDGNPGASSIFKATGKYTVEQYIQDEVEVDAIPLQKALAQNNFKQVDMLWMDIQGAELLALKSLGPDISNVRIIHTEVEFIEIYQGQALYWDIKKYLNSKGFYLAAFTHFTKNISGDGVFININNVGLLRRIKYYLNNKFLHTLLHYGLLKL